MRKNALICLFVILFIWLLILTSISLSIGSNSKDNESISQYRVSGFSTDLSSVVESSKSMMVAIEQNGNVSSGFIYAKKDDYVYIGTSYHGVSHGDSANILFNSGADVSGKLMGYDIFADVALIECYFPYDVNVLTIGDSTLLKDGEFVLSIGTNGDLDYAFSTKFGMVSNKYLEIKNQIVFNDTDYDYYLGLIMLSGDFTAGYSGSALLNMKGELVGMITMENNDQVLALSGNELKVVLDKIYDSSIYTRLNLGIKGKYIADLENYEKNSLNVPVDLTYGYYIDEIMPYTFATSLGLNKGYLILKINDQEIISSKSMLNIIYSNEHNYVFDILRNGENIRLEGAIND